MRASVGGEVQKREKALGQKTGSVERVGWEQGNGREKGGIQGLRAFRRYGKRQEAGRETGPSQDGAGGFAGRDRGRAGEPGVLERGSQEGLQGRSAPCRVDGEGTVRGRNCLRAPPIPFAVRCKGLSGRSQDMKNAERWTLCSCAVSETKIHISSHPVPRDPAPPNELCEFNLAVSGAPRELAHLLTSPRRVLLFSLESPGAHCRARSLLATLRPRFSAKSGSRF